MFVGAIFALATIGSVDRCSAQQNSSPTKIPEIVVTPPKHKPQVVQRGAPSHVVAAPSNSATVAQAALDAKMTELDRARDNLLPTIGASTYTITRDAIEKLPQ